MSMALQKNGRTFCRKGCNFFRLLDYFLLPVRKHLSSTIPMACLYEESWLQEDFQDSEITAMRSAGVSFSRIYANFQYSDLYQHFLWIFEFYLAPENTRKMNEFNN